MKAYNYFALVLSCAATILLSSCKDLDEMNIDPNGIDPSIANPSHLIATVIAGSGTTILNLGFGDLSGLMQHTQLDGWAKPHNTYQWDGTSYNGTWGNLFTNLRNAKEMMVKAEEEDNDFHKGVSLIFMAYNFGTLADLWGDVPFSEALRNDEGIMNPKYDSQFDIYKGVLEYLDQANTLLSRPQSEYNTLDNAQDILYGGDVTKWRKFANSLSLRYFLRLSEKEPEFARAGVTKILGDDAGYPLILEASDDAAFAYAGNNSASTWPTSTQSDPNNFSSGYHRTKFCSTLVEPMRHNNDPRLAVWANPVEIPLILDESQDEWPLEERREVEFTINGEKVIRTCRVIGKVQASNYINGELNPDTPINYNADFVGMPPGWTRGSLYSFNLNPAEYGQGGPNPHCSMLNDIYQLNSHPLLKARMVSAAEIQFDLAEIALKGWGGNAKEHYDAAIKASFETWGVSDGYDSYLAQPDVVFDNSLKQVIFQKWIASWSATGEAWFDWRRTGYPELDTPRFETFVSVLPVRFYYVSNEEQTNLEMLKGAMSGFEETIYSMQDPVSSDPIKENSAWSKMWLLQGTGKPW